MEFASFVPMLAQEDTAPGAIASRVARQLFASPSGTSLVAILLFLAARVMVQILASWIAAKVVIANEHCTLSRAALLWLQVLVVTVGLVLFGAVAFVFAFTLHLAAVPIIVAILWLLLVLFVMLMLPGKAFETDLLRSFGFIVLSSILAFAGGVALDRATGHKPFAHLPLLRRLVTESNERRQRRLQDVLHGSNTTEIEDELDRLSRPEELQRPIPERQASLRTVFDMLETRRRALRPNDQPGKQEFDALRQRYDDLVRKMKEDYAAPPQPPAPNR